MKRRWLCAFALASLPFTGTLEAQRLAVIQGMSGYAYGSGYMSAFSTQLSNRFGGAVDIYNDWNVPLPGATAVFVWLRNPSDVLSVNEVSNLQGWIASGARVAAFTENYGWSGSWNPSMIGAMGGTDCSTTNYSNAAGTPLVLNALTAGITSIGTQGAPGCAGGGTALFSNTFATLYGNNALLLSDLNTLDTFQQGISPQNVQWGNNVADWLYNTVPEPGSILLVASGLAGVAFAARRRRRG